MPKLPPNKAAKPPQKDVPEYKDTYGIVYLNGEALVHVSVDAKLSRNYQSCGAQCGMTFTTRADLADSAVANAFKKLRDALRPQLQEASSILDAL